ncbi:GTPase HflX [Sedimentibacter sp. zth1]|uniref:GTPase HflX n=1 Tax=Sedimentibacter sp. zth1 TaxID=2816908 RepID=UPI001A919C6B|nr:GTPase HflX [Sedimentibacter sp. zth1]QSX06405.1 GTPase HflX [Sedimentibacter sp. zth1]
MENTKEKCLLVGIQLSSNEEDNDMQELTELVKAADGEVLGTVIQNRNSIDNRYYLGQGKLEEIANYAKELDVDSIIFNDELTGTQIRNIEEIVDTRVIDRTTLILDIFARRALTNEGKLQVELAQLKYKLPRLVGMRKDLSRQGGGIGTKGPGEKKIETDKRHILTRILDIESLINKIDKVRDTKRKKRMKDEIPVVSIVGYTNAGKSTLLNALIETCYNSEELENKKVFVKDMLFATLDTEHRKVKLPGGRFAIFSDTVGFIKKLPTQIVKAFKGTLEELKYANVILHLIDINDENLEAHKQTTVDLINQITDNSIPVVTVYNKTDKIDNKNIAFLSNENNLYVSAAKKNNIDNLLEYVDKKINGDKNKYEMKIPNSELKVFYSLFENRFTDKVEYEADGVKLEAIIYEDEKYKYNEYIVK